LFFYRQVSGNPAESGNFCRYALDFFKYRNWEYLMGRVLYAEDEYTNRKLLEIQFKNVGIDCELALDGNMALQLFLQNSYDVVILDQYMPGMNGDQVAREIRKVNQEIPLIAITSDDSDLNKLKQAGFNEIFIKPLRGQNYLNIIKTYLGV
jgi:two-component system response regulator ResD